MELRHILFSLREGARQQQAAAQTLSGGLTVRVVYQGDNTFRVDVERQGSAPSMTEVTTVKRAWLYGVVVRTDPMEKVGPTHRVGFVSVGHEQQD